MGSEPRLYRLGPFLIESEVPLPELDMQGEGEPDVRIRLGTAPGRLETVVANETRWWASTGEYLQRVPGVATFYVRGGREVTVEPAENSLPGDIRAYLLAPIFSQVCFQAGMYALHASSVAAGRGVAAFVGDSGAGKSTLAAYLEQRGYPVVSDDLCLLDAGLPGKDRVRVVPVAPALKLWRTALEQLGGTPTAFPKVWSQEDKFRLRVGAAEERLPLRVVFFLEWHPEPAGDAVFEPVHGAEAVTRLMRMVHFDYLLKGTERQAECFELCARILREAPAFVLRRPKNFARASSVNDAVERHLAGLG